MLDFETHLFEPITQTDILSLNLGYGFIHMVPKDRNVQRISLLTALNDTNDANVN